MVRRSDRKFANEHKWLRRWVAGETIEQLVKRSGKRKATMHRLLLRELAKPVPPSPLLRDVTHVLFDGKFLFGRRFCFLVILNAATNKPIAGKVVRSEARTYIESWLRELKAGGLSPVAVTTDGKQSGINAFRAVWPGITIQRCLFHVRLQVESWARAKPKKPVATAVKQLCEGICNIETEAQAKNFVAEYAQLRCEHGVELSQLDRYDPVESDTLKAYQLMYYALPNCFKYTKDSRIAKTTSALEGYFKQVQRVKGFQHNGLTEEHLFQFLGWKIYYDNLKTNTK